MDWMNRFLNLVAPPIGFATLLLLIPPLYIYKFIRGVAFSLFPEKLKNKVVVISGATSGIGEHLAYEYAKKGAFLVLVARRERALQEVADRARDLGAPDVLIQAADVAKPSDCHRFIDATINRFGRIDHLVNNAGVANACMFEDITDATDFKEILDVNFWGSVYPTQYAIPYLKKSKGRIVVTASGGALYTALPRMSFYNASKAAVFNFFETLRIELAPDVRVTTSFPGWIESELSKGKFINEQGKTEVDQDVRDIQVSGIPMVYAEDCAKSIIRAACRGDRYVTVPSWFSLFKLWRALAPELVDMLFRLVAFPKLGTKKPPIKAFLDSTGAKEILYTPSIKSPEIKHD